MRFTNQTVTLRHSTLPWTARHANKAVSDIRVHQLGELTGVVMLRGSDRNFAVQRPHEHTWTVMVDQQDLERNYHRKDVVAAAPSRRLIKWARRHSKKCSLTLTRTREAVRCDGCGDEETT